jgi:hypothetical protein
VPYQNEFLPYPARDQAEHDHREHDHHHHQDGGELRLVATRASAISKWTTRSAISREPHRRMLADPVNRLADDEPLADGVLLVE